MSAVSAAAPSRGWHASLLLELQREGARTVVARRASVGPLVVQRPFYPEAGVCHIYVVHPPGGVVGGDRLELRVLAKEGAHALITTPAATKIYRSDGPVARQTQEVDAQSATVEWLPQETIVFPDARAQIATRVKLDARSRFVGWEIACYGRPASGLALAGGRVAQDFELWVDGEPVVLDRLRLNGEGESMQAVFGLAGRPVLGTLLAYPADDTLLARVRAVMTNETTTMGSDVTAACTRVDGALVCRAIASQADAVRTLFTEIWRGMRPALLGRVAVSPRIWAT